MNGENQDENLNIQRFSFFTKETELLGGQNMLPAASVGGDHLEEKRAIAPCAQWTCFLPPTLPTCTGTEDLEVRVVRVVCFFTLQQECSAYQT